MTQPPETFLDRLAAQARQAEAAEADYRADYRATLDRLERERAYANRRLRFVRKLAAAIDDAGDQDAALAAGDRLLNEEFGLTPHNPAHAATLSAFRTVSDEVDTALNCEGEPDHSTVMQRLAAFEADYEARTGVAFFALYDVYMPETPKVDF